MLNISPGDVLKALKKCKRLAKQDLLASGLTSDPEFWREHAQARRATYDALMALIENEGVDAAHRYAVNESAALPLLDSAGDTAAVKGRRQALEMFFSIIGEGIPGAADAATDTPVRLEASS